jgi:uncharacterized membrane protein YdjX (TVP38/TMEM64 family)
VILLGALLAASAALCLVAISRGWLRPEALQELARRAGSAAMLAYVGGVILLELLWAPRIWGLLAGGALFGPLLGGLLSLGADLCGATICFYLARGGGREWVGDLLARRPRANRIVELLARRRGALVVALLRVCPIAHYTLVSYAAGLTGVRPGAFLLGTALGILPGAVIYPIAGDAALRPGSPAFVISLAAVAVALVVTLWIGRRLLRGEPEAGS